MATYTRMSGLIGLAAAAALGLTACGGSSGSSGGEAAADNTSTGTPMQTSAPAAGEMDPAANLVGPGCADYAAQVPDGAGSVGGMAKDPVATAASNNPLLTTLTAAVSGKLNPDVDLVDTLNGGKFTVFAPVDSAFEKVPAKSIEALKTDADALTSILTYHVVPGQIAPDKLSGELKTVQGEPVKITGSGDALKVNDAKVVCGGVQTANATVYLIDTVLMPPAK
jgi:uncharacterized surface protein with fasciclin (FAS1) repeats